MSQKGYVLKLIVLILVVGITTSCATHRGYLSSNAVLIDNSFHIVGIGIGESESLKVMGIGGLKRGSLVYDAKNDLYRNVELAAGQALTNITVDFKREYYLVYSKTKVTVTGEIVDFNPGNQKNFYGLKVRNGYNLGEQVYVKIKGDLKKSKIVRLDLKKLQIEETEDESNHHSPMTMKYEDVFRLNGEFESNNMIYSIGSKIEIVKEIGRTPSGNVKTHVFIGKVIGISMERALILDETNNQYKIIKIDKK